MSCFAVCVFCLYAPRSTLTPHIRQRPTLRGSSRICPYYGNPRLSQPFLVFFLEIAPDQASSTRNSCFITMESDISRRQLCVFCQGINLEDIKSNDGYVHQPTCHALISSADTCALCQLIFDLSKRFIYKHFPATSSIGNLSDAGHLGPIRLFAASHELDLNLRPFQRRERGRVKDKQLSKMVAITLDMMGTELIYGPNVPTLLMFADPGK